MSRELAEALECEVDEEVKERYEELKKKEIHPADPFDTWDEALDDYKQKVNDGDIDTDEELRKVVECLS